MKTKSQLIQKLNSLKASISTFMTSEAWVDKNGNIFYVDRSPIEWDRIGKPKDTEVVK